MGGKKIRLDISRSQDIFHLDNKNSSLSFGIDLFTFTRLRAESEFHFPVEAIDYLFGINSGYKITNENTEYGLRFRLSHISAHFVDGQYDYKLNFWRNGRTATVYTREFIELITLITGIRIKSICRTYLPVPQKTPGYRQRDLPGRL